MADMTRVLVVSAVLALSGCASTPPGEYRQAVARPAPAGPLIVQQPPSYPGATYTPAGAGAYRGDPLPSKPVPRSPNKRILPATKEPTVYAADGDPQASVGHWLFYVHIPTPEDTHGPVAKTSAQLCVDTLTGAANQIGKRALLDATPLQERMCIAARAFRHCAEAHRRAMERAKEAGKKATGPRYDPIAVQDSVLLWKYAIALEAKNCADVRLSDEQYSALIAVLSRWTDTFTEYR